VDLPAGKVNTASDPDPQLQEVRELLEETVSLEMGATESSDQLKMHFDSRGLVIRVSVKDFFDEGKVEVREDLWPVLDRIGRVLCKTKRLIRLEGHIDVNEAMPNRFANGWEFSAARAAWLAKFWISRFGFDPAQLGVAGFSDARPLAKPSPKAGSKEGSGAEPWQKAKNRRLEIILLNNRYESQ
jgi:chemotaxis protein MotB